MRARARPTSIPPPPISKKLRPASHTENAPLTTAATATLKATRPVPSLTRLSPLTSVPTRSGTPNLPKIASAATGSVGARMAPRTKAAAHGRPIRACAITATAPIVASTSPTASSTIGLSWARRSSGEEHLRGDLDVGQAWHEAHHEAPKDQQDRVGHLQKAGELGEQCRGSEQEDERLDLVHLSAHPPRLLTLPIRACQGPPHATSLIRSTSPTGGADERSETHQLPRICLHALG